MKKLWIDDIRDTPDSSWTEVRKVEPAIKLLSMYDFDVISIDHDIENRPDDETFKPIAYFLGEKYRYLQSRGSYFWNPQVIIHSVNPVGAKEIHDILKDYGLDSEIKPYESDEAFRTRWGLDQPLVP